MKEITSLQGRVPWRVASALLKAQMLPVGRGWEGTLSKISSLEPDTAGALTDACNQHILCGEKNIRLYRVSEELAAKVVSKAKATIDSSSTLVKAYPFSLQGDDLAEITPNQPEVVAVDEQKDLTIIVLATCIVVPIREDLDKNLLIEALGEHNSAIAARVKDSEVIQTVRSEWRHAYDVVCLRKDKGVLEVRVDFFDSLNRPLKVAEIEDSHIRAGALLLELAGRSIYGSPINLYPVIRKLLAINDGGSNAGVRISKCGYLGHTGISREEKKAHGDVRSDPSHLAAVEAHGADVDQLEVYDIEVNFPSECLVEQPDITLAIHGTEALARSDTSFVRNFSVTKCLFVEDYERIMKEVYDRV